MKAIKILGILVLIVVMLGAIGFFVPANLEIKGSIDIERPAGMVFEQVNSPSNWINWSKWDQLDPDQEVEYPDPKAGVGAKKIWRSEHQQVGNGSFEVT